MDVLTQRPPTFGSSVFPDSQTELRWRDADLWTIRRPYPIEVPCPVCGAHARCDFFGRQRCPHGHLFGQRAFWSGRATSCWLLIEDPRDGRTLVFPEARLSWRDDVRTIAGPPALRTVGRRAPEAPP